MRKTVDSLRVLDKKYTDKVNLDNNIFKLVIYNLQWRRNSRKQIKVLKPLIAKFGYPGERLIGLDNFYSDTTRVTPNKKLKLNIEEYRCETMFIHYFSIRRKSMNSFLLPNVKSGYLEANAYGSFNDFQSRKGKNNFYNVWHLDPNKSNLDEINKRRDAIGLEAFERQNEKFKIEFDRRGKPEFYSKINLEINH